MQMFTANQLRQMHEDRIAPYINNNEGAKPKNKERKSASLKTSLLNQVKSLTMN